MASYVDVAGPSVPPIVVERRELLLEWLRCEGGPYGCREIQEIAHLYGVNDYDVLSHDLRQLERYGLVRSIGHPKQWSAS